MTMIRAALKRIVSRDRLSRFSADDADLRRALSLVLHEHSDSVTVQTAARDAQRHADMWHRPNSRAPVVKHDPIPRASIWLTATLGCPAGLKVLASSRPSPVHIIAADHLKSNTITAEFFRSPATLHLPSRECNVIVIATVVRPGNRDLALFWDGPFAWPGEQDTALRALETLIQAHVGQWRPPRNLWSGGAESVLPRDEIRDL